MLLRHISSPPPPLAAAAAACRNPAPFLLLLRRHRRRRRPYPVLRSSLFEFLSELPSSLALLAPAAAAAVALASSFSSQNRLPPPADEPDGGCGDVAGEWILFTSPTPFNRCVLLRCPSVSFEDGGVLLDGVNERLLTEERHYVNLSRGRIPAAGGEDGTDDLYYQRICVPLEDGGVIALDWPDNLDLGKEYGLDSTVVVMPGTPEGSMESGVKMFVLDALKNGYFPIVMNPRGCGGSPLTTARLFTAADSDDICTAIRFINSKRPWTTLMGVGWGYGANMLTKYLAEVGESTPLTAAVCIDNPFDLEEATRSFPHHIALDRKLTAGLVDILRANKELFQGKAKDFDVQKALSASSLRDFDGAISMVSHGFDTIDKFYAENSTRLSIAHIKIPVLFIQSDDGTVPLLSVPRSSIAENPFTSLLLCSCAHSTIFTFKRYAVLWCQNLTLEWLSAVEFALLKGRHPLIKDVDITINPSKGLAFVEPQVNDRNIPKNNKLHQRSQFILYNNAPNGGLVNGLLVDSLANGYSRAKKENGRLNNNDEIGRVNKDSDAEELEESSADVEGSHVLQSATVVINMLDATMPGTLDDDQKKKVLMAVEQGETLMKALEEAVPEDVRGKITTSVAEILQSKRTNFSLDALKRLGWTNATSTAKMVVQEKVKDSDHESGSKDAKMLDHNKGVGTITDGDQKDDNLISNDNNTGENIELLQGKPSQTSAPVGAGTETGGEQIQSNKLDKANPVINEGNEEQHRTEQANDIAPKHVLDDQSTANSNGAPRERVQSADAIAEQNPQYHVVEKESDAVRTSEEKATQNVTDQSLQVSKTEESSIQNPPTKPPSINVTQALDALTGFDDSTQMAVNSVFGVLENMIDQFQKQNNADTAADIHKMEKGSSDGALDEHSVNEIESQATGDTNNGSGEENISPFSCQPEDGTSGRGPATASKDGSYFVEKNSMVSIVSSAKGKISNSQRSRANDYVDADVTNPDTNLPNFLLDIAINSYLKAQYAMYLHEHLRTQLQKSPELNPTTDLFLDPQEGKWKMVDQMENVNTDIPKSDRYSGIAEEIKDNGSSQSSSGTDSVLEPSVLREKISGSKFMPNDRNNSIAGRLVPYDALRETLTCFIRDELGSALKVEVRRKLALLDVEELDTTLAHDVKHLAAQISKTVVLDCKLYAASCVQRNPTTVKFGLIHGENVIEAVSTAVQQSTHLKNILPVGVIVGVTLASLRNYFHVGVSKHDDHLRANGQSRCPNEELVVQESGKANTDNHREKDGCLQKNSEEDGGKRQLEMSRSEGQGMMVGAVTAALGASALLAHHQQKEIEKHNGMDSTTAASHDKDKPEEKSQNNLMSSFAEKALSVAAPVVPTKGDGEVDHDRLVAVLAELGQKGGILRFVGKIALLWGGIRGAMSLTDRLISFLRISERPLFQRIMGFAFMVLVLWSPVVIPLLPTLVQSWTISASTGIVGYACVAGLYVSVMILVMLWGKRIRGYENPVEQYGMDLASIPRVQEFFQGLIGGMTVVGLVHSISILLGFANLQTGFSAFLARPVDFLKSSSNLLLLAVRGVVTATSIAVVEEVVFRSWLPEEITVDLGYYNAILISGVAFSLIHRSLPSVPGFLLLSLVLSGIKQRMQGKLAAPIGLRAGIMTANHLIQSGGVITYRPETPLWMISTYQLHPFDGVIGLSICTLLAALFFPQKPVEKDTSIS